MLFVSVLLHELGHSVVAKRYGIPVPQNHTVHIRRSFGDCYGAAAARARNFGSPRLVRLSVLLLALIFWEMRPFLVNAGPLLALAKYLAILNFVLGIFNLVPGLPLDGGRVFRSILWGITRNFRRSSAIATVTGRFVRLFLIFVGVWQVLAGNMFDGVWIAVIGWFLESAAASQDQLRVVKDLLGGHKVSEVMSRDFPRIPGDMTLQELVDKDVLAQGHRSFVVGRWPSVRRFDYASTIKEVPRSSWPKITASQVMIPLETAISIRPAAELWTALEKMGRDGVNQLPVLNGGGGDRVVGMLSRDDLVHYLRILQALAK